MKQLTNSIKRSAANLKNIRSLSMLGLLLAMNIAISYATQITLTPWLKIGFSFVTQMLVGWLFGPVSAMVTGGLGDIIKYLIKPTGAYFPGYTLNAILAGLLWGIFLYDWKGTTLNLVVRLSVCKLSINLLINAILGTLWSSVLFGRGFLILLPERLIKNLIQTPVDIILCFVLIMALEAAGLPKLIQSIGRRRGNPRA